MREPTPPHDASMTQHSIPGRFPSNGDISALEKRNDAVRRLQAQVEARFGVLPNFFRLAPESPEVTENLWGFAQFAYLDNPLPSLFKERLFVYLSRFCEVRYCIARHVGFLLGLGRPSGDSGAPIQTIEDVIRLLRRPLPRAGALEPYVLLCADAKAPLAELPAPDSAMEQAMFACATHAFLQTGDAPRCLSALQCALGESMFQHLLSFLAFVRTAHYWTRLHTELAFEEDVRQLMGAHEALAECLLNDPEAATCEITRKLMDEAVALREVEARNDESLRAHQALAESERHFREMIDALPNAIYTTDAEGRLTHYNPTAVEFSGHRPQLGTDQWCVSWKLYYPDGRPMPHDQCPMALALKEGRAIRGAEAIAERPDGKRIWFTPYPSPLRDTEGRIIGGINMLVDITERKQAEEALRLSHAELRAHAEDLTRFNRAAVGRELRMIELKKEVNELCRQLSQTARYSLEFDLEKDMNPQAQRLAGAE